MPFLIDRRQFLRWSGASSLGLVLPGAACAVESFDFRKARAGYLGRLEAVRRSGQLPIIDIESSCNPLQIDLVAFTRLMDRAGVALMCLSVDQPRQLVERGMIWSDRALDAFEQYPAHFIPTGNGGNHPAWTRSAAEFLVAQEQFIVQHRYPIMGELEVRHYPSPRQLQRGQTFRDVDIPIDGPLMERVFQFSEKSGIPFQIHYEIEDRLLDPLEQMLSRFPNARVIWCHLAQIRYQERSTRYSPAMLARWLERYPNLYVDTAFGDALSVYPLSAQRHARYWRQSGEWSELISAWPWRFLAALDIGGDRMDRIEAWTRNLRQFLQTLPEPVREIVAYKAAWKLLFNEEL
jgi:hypothetical protein